MALTNAAGFSDYVEQHILGLFKGTYVFATPSTTAPAAPTFYAGLFTANPTDTGTTGGTADGTEMTTTNGTTGFAAYARIAESFSAILAASGAPLSDSTGQEIQNSGALTWAANNGGSTVTVTGIGIWDAATGGNLWYYIPITSQAVANGTVFSIGAAGETLGVD